MAAIEVRILGAGCTKCRTLEQKIRALAEASRIDIDITKVTDLDAIIGYGVMMTPGLVIDGVLKSYGAIPKDDQLLAWLKGTQ